jgi:glycosyltransferase involved in cell wall biosynthesis
MFSDMNRHPDICIFTETYFPVVGGGETQARLLAEGLVAENYKVMVLTRRTNSTQKRKESIGGVEVFRLAPSGGQHWKKWGLLFTGFLALIRYRKQYDLILVSGYRVIGIAAVLVSLITGKICILKADNNGEMSGSFFKGGMARYGLRENSFLLLLFLKIRNAVLRRAQAFVAISSDIRRELIQYGNIPTHKIHYIPNSVDTSLFHPVNTAEKLEIRKNLGLPEKALLVVFTGRLVSYKGLFTLLKSWEQICKEHTNVALLLVGGGSLDIYNCEDELKDYVQRKKLQDCVYFMGEVQNVTIYLQAADIFVFPTEKEAFGISLIEAMACGLPVISTDVGGLKDIIIDEWNGLKIQPGEVHQLNHAIKALLDDSSLTQKIGRNALETTRKSYSIETVLQQYIELFRGQTTQTTPENRKPVMGKPR